MNNHSNEKRHTIVHVTPEMANWMHPQNEQRKQLIQKQVEAAKTRFAQRTRQEEKSVSTTSNNTNITQNQRL